MFASCFNPMPRPLAFSYFCKQHLKLLLTTHSAYLLPKRRDKARKLVFFSYLSHFVSLPRSHCRGHHLQEEAGNSGAIQPALFQCGLMHWGQHHCYEPASGIQWKWIQEEAWQLVCQGYACIFQRLHSVNIMASVAAVISLLILYFCFFFLVLPWCSGARIAAAIVKGERKMLHAISLISPRKFTINTSIFTSVGPSANDNDRCIPCFFLDHSWLASDGDQDWNFKMKATSFCKKHVKTS